MRPRVGTKGWAPLEVEQKDEKDKKERKKDAVVQNWCLTSRAPYKEGEGFIGVMGLAVVMGKDFGHFGKAVAAAALDFLGDPRMKHRACFGEKALIECVPH